MIIRNIINYLKQNRKSTATELAENLETPIDEIKSALDHLEMDRKIEKIIEGNPKCKNCTISSCSTLIEFTYYKLLVF